MIDKFISRLEDRSAAANTQRIREILELRRILEPEIAARAARSLGERDIELLQAIVDRQEQDLVRDGEDDAGEDLHFHVTLARATKNEVIVEVTALIYDLLKESRVPPLVSPERKKASFLGHRRIFAALKERDPEVSRAAMLSHLFEIDLVLYGGRRENLS